MKKLLFVCSGGVMRSPTFAKWFNKHTKFEAKFLGLWNNPDHKLFDWADKIFVMDLSHEYWFQMFRPQLLPKVEVVGISDQYDPDDSDLIDLIKYWYCKRFMD
jgi:predicted protein tyrosine phosphatase